MALEDVDQPDEVGKRAGEPVDLVADDRVHLARLDVAQQSPQRRAIHRPAGEAAVVVAVVEGDPALLTLALDVGKAGLVLRIQRIERLVESLLGALPAVDRRSDFARRRVHLAVPVRRRPKNTSHSNARSGDFPGDRRQRLVWPAVVLEVVLADGDHVLDALPLAPQLCAGDRTPGIAPAGGLGLELVDQGIELAPGPIGEPAEVQFLNAVGKPILEIAPAQHRWLAVEQLAPHLPQFGRRLGFQRRDLCQDRVGHRRTCLRCRAVACTLRSGEKSSRKSPDRAATLIDCRGAGA